jgi:transposase-like protein
MQQATDAVAIAAEVLERGGTITEAAAQAGVNRRTVQRWRERGLAELERVPQVRVALATTRPAPQGTLERDDLIRLLEESAANHNVRAIELLLRRADERQAVEDNPFAEFHQLAARRQHRSS